MSESVRSSVKSCGKKNKSEKPVSASFSQCSSNSRATVNSGMLSLLANARIKKLEPPTSEQSSLGEKDPDVDEIENYYLEYSKYLLRKAQNRVLSANRKIKEEAIKICLVSLKLKFEQLLEENVKLNKEVESFQTYCDVLTRVNKKIQEGGEVLRVLRETDFERLLKSLSSLLDCSINQLELVDIDKNLIDDAFRKKIWGSGSEIELSLKKIESFLSNDQVEMSNIAGELVEIKRLALDNAMMREKFNSLFKAVSEEISETNYQLFTGTLKKAFDQREKCKSDNLTFSLDCDLGFLHPDLKLRSSQPFRPSFSNLEGSCHVLPNSSSTPLQDKQG